MENLSVATFGGGCFWCIEAVIQRLKGVESIKSGYSDGFIKNPAYREVCTGRTGHAEVIQVTFNPDIISYHDLIYIFMTSHDPTTLNQQGADIGTQYRSEIFYHSDEQKKIAEDYIALMTSLPLTLIGVVLALLAFNSTLSMFSIIGVVMLMGLVTKNAILLVDFAIRSREDHLDETGKMAPGLPRAEALLLAAKVRLRPILMTTLAMVFGMVPLAFALTEGSEQRAPMGQAVIGGVITSSLLTLVVVPVMYCYMDDLANWIKRKFGASTTSHSTSKIEA